MKLKFLVSACCLLLTFVAWAMTDADAILLKLQKKYESIRDASVTFTQIVRFGVTNAEQSFTGKLLMKKEKKYRLELEQQTIVTDGKSVWSFSKLNNQILIDKYKEDPRSFTPDRVLVNVPNEYNSVMMGSEKLKDRETTIVKLIPKNTASNIKWMKVWVDTDDWLMKKIQVFDISDNLMTYFVEDLKLNSGLADSTFQFDIPPDVEVIDLR